VNTAQDITTHPLYRPHHGDMTGFEYVLVGEVLTKECEWTGSLGPDWSAICPSMIGSRLTNEHVCTYRRRIAAPTEQKLDSSEAVILPEPVAVVGDKYEKNGWFCEVTEVTPDAVKYIIGDRETISTHAEFKRLEKKTLDNGATFIPSPEREPFYQKKFITVVFPAGMANLDAYLGFAVDYREGNYLEKFDAAKDRVINAMEGTL
jgi:hypothetical protein